MKKTLIVAALAVLAGPVPAAEPAPAAGVTRMDVLEECRRFNSAGQDARCEYAVHGDPLLILRYMKLNDKRTKARQDRLVDQYFASGGVGVELVIVPDREHTFCYRAAVPARWLCRGGWKPID